MPRFVFETGQSGYASHRDQPPGISYRRTTIWIPEPRSFQTDVIDTLILNDYQTISS